MESVPMVPSAVKLAAVLSGSLCHISTGELSADTLVCNATKVVQGERRKNERLQKCNSSQLLPALSLAGSAAYTEYPVGQWDRGKLKSFFERISVQAVGKDRYSCPRALCSYSVYS